MRRITVMIKEPGKPPLQQEIPSSLTEMHRIVNGYVKVVRMTSNVLIVCNEEINLPRNFRLGDMPIAGDVIFTGVTRSGNFASLTEESINMLQKAFEGRS